MDDLLSAIATMFTWLGGGARAYTARWFRRLRRKPVIPDHKEPIRPVGDGQ